jgi:hypothetical protein
MTTITEIQSPRTIDIQTGGDQHDPATAGSVFLTVNGEGPNATCIEVDRAEFLAAIRAEFGLVDPLESLLAS